MRWLAPLLLVLVLAGCASTSRMPESLPPGPSRSDSDGPPLVRSPEALLAIPDAIPRIEPIRQGGPNKPYEVDGQRFEPIAHDSAFKQRGIASWYGRKFHGRPTANGETYNMYAMTAAHPRLPLPSYVRVRNPANGREAIVRVNDRGPFVRGRIIDLSYAAAFKLDLHHGIAPVEIERITFDEIRSGRFNSPPDEEPLLAPPQAAGQPEVADTQQLREPLQNGEPKTRTATRGIWLQLGAFRQLAGAEGLVADLAQRFPDIGAKFTLVRDRELHRVQLGPLSDRELASRIAQRLRDGAGIEPLLLQR